MKMHFPWSADALWITPGGGLRRGESASQALLREVEEETGLRAAGVGPLLWRREQLWDQVDPPVLQREEYYLLERERFEPRSDGLRHGRERDCFGGFRWWAVAELPDRAEAFAPTRIGALVRSLLREGVPRSPLRIAG